MVIDLVDLGATRLVLERIDTQKQADRRVIRDTAADLGADLIYLHLRGREDPLLWAADAITWAYAAGGDWRRRVAPLFDKAVLLDP